MSKICVLVLSMIVLLPCHAFALTILQGSQAKEHLGEIKHHFLSANYTYDILARSHRDSMHGRFSDGVVFNADGGNFEFLKNKDGERDLVLDSPSGRPENTVTEELWRHKIENTLSDDNNIPYVFLDENHKEIAVLFVGNGTQVSGKMTPQNLLQITLSVEGGKDHRGRRRMMT